MSLEGFRAFIGEQIISQPSGRHEIVRTNLYCFGAKVRFGAKRTFWRIVRFGAGVCFAAKSTISGEDKKAILLICNGVTVPKCRGGRTEGGRKKPNERMRMYQGTVGLWVQGAAVEVLRGLYLWSGRHFHREVLRRELWRIGRSAAEARRKLKSGRGTEGAVRLRQNLTPG